MGQVATLIKQQVNATMTSKLKGSVKSYLFKKLQLEVTNKMKSMINSNGDLDAAQKSLLISQIEQMWDEKVFTSLSVSLDRVATVQTEAFAKTIENLRYINSSGVPTPLQLL